MLAEDKADIDDAAAGRAAYEKLKAGSHMDFAQQKDVRNGYTDAATASSPHTPDLVIKPAR